MKLLICSSLLFLSLSSQASNQQLLLDASCKFTCLISETEVVNDQGTPTLERQYEKSYLDLFGLTREQIENKTEVVNLDKVCKLKFGNKSMSKGIDCLYFKH